MSTLISCQPPPPAGWVSVVEYECRFEARPLSAASPSRSPVDSQRSEQIILASAGVRVRLDNLMYTQVTLRNLCSTRLAHTL